MKLVTVLTPCFNEEENVVELHAEVARVFAGIAGYRYEHLFIDNASTDSTARRLRELAAAHPNVKVILNRRNFGHVRSPYHGLLAAGGEAIITIACDFQDPPALIPAFLAKWESGIPVVLGVKTKSEESFVFFAVRTVYYRLLKNLAEVPLVEHATGFGLYDRSFIEALRSLGDPYPYIRGLITDFGFDFATVPYEQPLRKRGLTKNNFFTLYDLAMLGLTTHSKLPLRLATIGGFALAFLSFVVALGYLAYKLVYWDNFALGIAPVVIGLFFAISVQLFFMGLLGEYILSLQTRALARPPVLEKERLNFARGEGDRPPGPDARGSEGSS